MRYPPGQVDVAVVSLGGNDLACHPSLQEWLKEIERLADVLRTRFAVRHILLSGLPPMHALPAIPQPLRWHLGTKAREYDIALKEWVARQIDCDHVPLIEPDVDLLASDGMHPGPELYRLWAGELGTRIRLRWIAMQGWDAMRVPAVPSPVGIGSEEVVIRAAGMSDAEPLARLVSELGYPTAPGQMRKRLASILADPAYSTLVALIDTGIAGFIGTAVRPSYQADGSFGQVLALVVSERHRRHGIGRQLIGSAEQLLVTRGALLVVVTTGNHRADAHAFYEKSGYVPTGRRYRKVLFDPASHRASTPETS